MSHGTWDKVEERRKMKEKVNNSRTRAQQQESRNKHQLLNKEVRKCCRKDKREYVNDLATEAEFAAYKGDIKTLYNITKTLSRRKTAKSKPVKDKDGKVLTNLNEQMERWNEYFVNVLNRPEPDQPVIVEPAGVDLNIKIDNIKKYEVKKAIKSLKNGKSAGIDEIPPEVFKSGGNDIIEYMYKLLNKIWQEEKIPTEWLKGLLVKLPKKGDLGLCENWRGITLLSVASKILCRIILSRIKDAIDQVLRDEQAGFRSNRSCTDQISTLRTIIEQSVEWQSSLYINFVDFERAFDSVNREGLWQLLRHYGIPTKIVNMIKALYEDYTVQVIHESSFTNPFHVNTGVKQGCLLSPTLFLIAIDWVTKQALDATPRGIQWNFAQRLEDLDFADDLALLSHSLKDMRDKTTSMK